MHILATIFSAAAGLILGLAVTVSVWMLCARLANQSAVHGNVATILLVGIFLGAPFLAFILARRTWRRQFGTAVLATLWATGGLIAASYLYVVAISSQGLADRRSCLPWLRRKLPVQRRCAGNAATTPPDHAHRRSHPNKGAAAATALLGALERGTLGQHDRALAASAAQCRAAERRSVGRHYEWEDSAVPRARVIRNHRRLGPLQFLRSYQALRKARATGDPEIVLRFMRPFHTRQFERTYSRVVSDPVGRRLLDEQRSLLPVLSDLESLQALPEGSLGREYARFMEEEELSVTDFAEASLASMSALDYRDQRAWTLAQRLRDMHDLIHVVSGYGRDLLGEMAVLSFSSGRRRARRELPSCLHSPSRAMEVRARRQTRCGGRASGRSRARCKSRVSSSDRVGASPTRPPSGCARTPGYLSASRI